MNQSDHKYYVEKIEQRERMLQRYEQSFLHFMEWFNENEELLKTIPVTRIPNYPLDK